MKKNFEIPFAESKKLSRKELMNISGGEYECSSVVCSNDICWGNCDIDTGQERLRG